MKPINLKTYQRVVYWTRTEFNEFGGYKKRYGRLIEQCQEIPLDQRDRPECPRELILDEETGQEIVVELSAEDRVWYKFAREDNDPYALF